MTSTFTPNKNLELPGFNDYVDSWNTPVNADFTAVDTALGGVTNLSVTAASGDITLTATQYRPFQIIISGTLTANVRYLIPASVGGQWTVTNSTTGAFTLKIASAAGGSDILLLSGTTMVSCDGTAGGMRYSLDAVTENGAQTLSNKRINPRVLATASASTLTPDISAYDQYAFTALAANLAINAPIGTPLDGNWLIIRILDDGSSRTLTWNATYTAIGVALPTVTTINKTTYVGCIYNASLTRWDVVAVATQA